MKLLEAVFGGVIILFLCWGLGEFFGFIYWIALHFMHGAPEAIFVPYYVFCFIAIVLFIYFPNREAGGKL